MAFFGFAAVWVSMMLWNHLVVQLFNAPILNFWQMFGLMILGRLICGGFGRRGGHWGKYGGMSHKWRSMSDEEKAEFKTRWKDKKVEDHP